MRPVAEAGAEAAWATAGSAVVLRPETTADAIFLRTLFMSHAVALLRPARLPAEQTEVLADMQHRSQTATHAARRPQARRWIALAHGSAVGRLVEADASDGVHIVDLAVTEDRLRSGVGSAIVRDAAVRATARGLGLRAEVAYDNAASLALFASLGFEAGPDVGAGRRSLFLPTAVHVTSPHA